MHYYLIIALQAFCIFHLIKNRLPYYWIFVIVFLPVIGSIIYILTQVFNRKDIDKINNDVQSIVNPTRKISELEKKLKFVDTYQNRVDLADAYFEQNLYKQAIQHYQFALNDNLQNNDYILEKLIQALYYENRYDEVLDYIGQIKSSKSFEGSESQFIYGLTLEKLNRIEEAELNLRPIDQRYSNYDQRLILAKFLIGIKKEDEGIEILKELQNETSHMNKNNKRRYRATIKEVSDILNKL